MRSLRPLTSRLSARLRHLSVFDDAVEVIEIDGPAEWDLDEVLALPEEFDRLVSHSANSTADRNLHLLTARTLNQGPSRMVRVRHAIIADGTVLTRRSYQAIKEQNCHWQLRGRADAIEEAALCSTFVTERYFAHWLHDGLPHELLAIDQGKLPLTLAGTNRWHERGYRNLVDLPAHPVSFACVKDLWLLDDSEFTRSRARRLQELVDRIRAQLPQDGPQFVFVGRGDQAVGRSLLNEPQVVNALEARGFTVIRPDELAPEEIASTLVNARIVVGVEGSALGHAIMAAPSGSGLVMMMGPRHFNMHYRPYAAGRGIRLSYTIGDDVGSETFSQPIDRLLKTIDLLDSALG